MSGQCRGSIGIVSGSGVEVSSQGSTWASMKSAMLARPSRPLLLRRRQGDKAADLLSKSKYGPSTVQVRSWILTLPEAKKNTT